MSDKTGTNDEELTITLEDGSFATEVLLADEVEDRPHQSSVKVDSYAATTRTDRDPRTPIASLPPAEDTAELITKITEALKIDNQIRVHYYVKIVVSALLCMLLLLIGVPVFMESRVTGSIAYTALGIVMVGFGLILAIAVIVLLFKPPFDDHIPKP